MKTLGYPACCKLVPLLAVICLLLTGCEAWHRQDPSHGEPATRNEYNRGVMNVHDNFGTGNSEPVHYGDW